MKYLLPLLLLFVSTAHAESFSQKLSLAAIERISHIVIYGDVYRTIDYPGDDVPAMFGVCTDIVIRAYRKLGIDLQKEVHQDMKTHFSKYPKNWGLKRTDTNIDHRCVPNLQPFFSRKGQVLKKYQDPRDYETGDIVTWVLPNNMIQIETVFDKKAVIKNDL